MTEPAAAGTAGTAFADLIKEQLTQERARKTSIEARGLSVITTSGGVVTLLFAVSALATKAEATFVLTEFARNLLVGATILFVVAILLALGTNVPLAYNEVNSSGFNDMLKKDMWEHSDVPRSERMVARARVDMITSGRSTSNVKAWFLIVAMTAEVLAILALAVAVLAIFMAASLAKP